MTGINGIWIHFPSSPCTFIFIFISMREQQTLFSYIDIAEAHFPKARRALKQRYQPHLEYLYLQTRRQEQSLQEEKKKDRPGKAVAPHCTEASCLFLPSAAASSCSNLKPACPFFKVWNNCKISELKM